MDFEGKYNDANSLGLKAIAADNSGNFEEAFNFYKTAIKTYVTVIKYDTIGPRKKAVSERVYEYILRIKNIGASNADFAIRYDTANRYEEALQHYTAAIEYLSYVAQKKMENEEFLDKDIKEDLQKMKGDVLFKLTKEKDGGYLGRAEAIKKLLAESPPKDKGDSNGNSSTMTKPKDTTTSKDKEKAELRGALQSAIVAVKPNVKWSDVAGLEGAKEALKEAVILPIKFPQLFTGKRVPWKGILLYGPPGTGKSYLAKAVATEADSVFYALSSSDLVSKWQGESEKLVRSMFEMARENKPAIIFIDEIDSLCTSRSEGENDASRRIKTEFLVQMDGVGSAQGGLLVLGATNVPWELDPAIRRRFEKRVYIALPEASARAGMFKLNLGDTPNSLEANDYNILGQRSIGFSGSDISILVRDAIMQPIRKCQKAQQFTIDRSDLYHPCEDYPNCPYCPMNLSVYRHYNVVDTVCKSCGATRMSLYDVPSDKLQVPVVSMPDFLKALDRVKGSVASAELGRFEQWTKEFGQEGE